MSRVARVLVPDCPHHIVQRGHNRKAVFVTDQDYRYYLATLSEWKCELDVKVYAFCLMTNHVHLVLNPGSKPERISLLMKRLAGRQTRFVNKLEGRTGSLWEGRYKASPIAQDEYLMQCCRYVDLNPVKAKMVAVPEQYSWSSYRKKIGMEDVEWLDFDPCYLALNNPLKEYRVFVEGGISLKEQEFIRRSLQSNGLTGSDAFVDEVEQRTGMRVEVKKRGRPKNKSVPI